MTHAEYANALRRIADWVEVHPELPVPFSKEIAVYPSGKEGLATYARALGSCEKVYTPMFAHVKRDFGGIAITASEYRSNVCERVVVGTEEVPEEIVPARLVPAHTREIVQWKCPESLLET